MGAVSLPFGNLSFGLRSTAVAALLLLLGSAVLFVALKSNPNPSLTGGNKVTPQPVTPESTGVRPGSVEVARGPIEQTPLPVQGIQRAPGMRNAVAGLRGGNRSGVRDTSQRGAEVLTRDELGGTYPTAAFPINASYQSLKVSVDDSRGTSRTISLPSVSFGSQKTLSQSASPLLASARDTW